MICLDTSAYSNFMRGHRPAVEAIIGAQALLVPSVVIGELRYGFKLGSRPRENEKLLAEFLREDVVQAGVVDERVSTHFADIMVDLRRSGTPIPTNDVWVAATAADAGATVLTYDEHFANIGRVASIVLRT